MKILSAFAICTLLFACANSRKANNNIEETKQEPIAAQLGDVTADSDPLTIKSASIDGNIITIDVEFSGGCEEHWVDLVGSFAVMKSLPPKRSIKLMHTANGDACRKVINETLVFDISALASSQTPGSVITLILDGFKGELTYTYP